MSGQVKRRARRPRVLLATRIFTPEHAAAAFRLQALVQALVDRDAEVEVLTTGGHKGVLMFGDAESPVVKRWPVLRDSSGYVRGYLPYMSFDLPLALRLLLVRRPDVVVVEPPPTTGAVVRVVTGVLGLLSGRPIPYVYYAADVWSDASASTGAPSLVVNILRGLERFALRGGREVIAVSTGVADRVSELGARSVQVVPNGIDTDVFRPDEPAQAGSGTGRGVSGDQERPSEAERHGIPPEPFLLYAGTASEWQGAEVFAQAMRHVLGVVPNAKLVFLGRGSSWPVLAQIAANLPDSAIDLRPLASPVVAALWHRQAAAAMVSVKPGLGYDFAYPTKVLAALACGTPVVYAGRGPAASDITEHQLGVAVPYDVDAVAEAMISGLAGGAAGDIAVGEHAEQARQRRVDWVQQHRSIAATGRAAADVVLGAISAESTAQGTPEE